MTRNHYATKAEGKVEVKLRAILTAALLDHTLLLRIREVLVQISARRLALLTEIFLVFSLSSGKC
jgi:hypothetical protein